jgi:hypothetical protein
MLVSDNRHPTILCELPPSFFFNIITTSTHLMFFFFFGGIEPRIQRVLQLSIGPCPLEEYHRPKAAELSVDLVVVSKKVILYLIPLWSVGQPHKLVHCRECGYTATPIAYEGHRLMAESRSLSSRQLEDSGWGKIEDFERLTRRQCTCGGIIKENWKYCPRCGANIGS